MLNVYDYYTVELLNFGSGQPTEYLKSLYERKVSNVQTRKAQLDLFSLPNESCSVSRNSLR